MVSTAAIAWAPHIQAGIDIPESTTGANDSECGAIVIDGTAVCGASGGVALPSRLKAPWNRSWLTTTAIARRGTESDRAVRAMQVIPANARQSTTATGLGGGPPARTWEQSATNTETAAAIQPRAKRAHRVVMFFARSTFEVSIVDIRGKSKPRPVPNYP